MGAFLPHFTVKPLFYGQRPEQSKDRGAWNGFRPYGLVACNGVDNFSYCEYG